MIEVPGSGEAWYAERGSSKLDREERDERTKTDV
jgi:hypothetical protein